MYLQAVVVADLLADLLAAGGGAHFSASRTRDGARLPPRLAVETEAPAALGRPIDRPIPRAIETMIRVGTALPPAAYDAPIGVSLAGVLRKSASSTTSTSICLAKSDRENRSCEDDRTCETRARISLLSSAPLERLSPGSGRSFTGEFQRFGT